MSNIKLFSLQLIVKLVYIWESIGRVASHVPFAAAYSTKVLLSSQYVFFKNPFSFCLKINYNFLYIYISDHNRTFVTTAPLSCKFVSRLDPHIRNQSKEYFCIISAQTELLWNYFLPWALQTLSAPYTVQIGCLYLGPENRVGNGWNSPCGPFY